MLVNISKHLRTIQVA